MRSAYAAVNGARSFILVPAGGPDNSDPVSEAGVTSIELSAWLLRSAERYEGSNHGHQKATDAQNRAQSEVSNYYNNHDRGGGFGGDLCTKGLLQALNSTSWLGVMV